MVEKSNVSPMRLTAAVAEKRIHDLAQSSSNIIWGTHARGRMAEREIFADDVLRILRTGHVDDAPVKTERDEWKCKIVLKLRGERSAGVVSIILHGGKLFLKTVEWEDV